ncbi:hypothetical protein ACFU8R_14030 [Pseudonocardia alni]|uniref:hypothetical protein n=1 Tax=Pseudonocardia alni TaxID=33907 RepID=UPI003698B11B
MLLAGAGFTVLVAAGQRRGLDPVVLRTIGGAVLLGAVTGVFWKARRVLDRERPRGVAPRGAQVAHHRARDTVAAQTWGYLLSFGAVLVVGVLGVPAASPFYSAAVGGASFGAVALAVRAWEAVAHYRGDIRQPDEPARTAS